MNDDHLLLVEHVCEDFVQGIRDILDLQLFVEKVLLCLNKKDSHSLIQHVRTIHNLRSGSGLKIIFFYQDSAQIYKFLRGPGIDFASLYWNF